MHPEDIAILDLDKVSSSIYLVEEDWNVGKYTVVSALAADLFIKVHTLTNTLENCQRYRFINFLLKTLPALLRRLLHPLLLQ